MGAASSVAFMVIMMPAINRGSMVRIGPSKSKNSPQSNAGLGNCYLARRLFLAF